MEEYLANHFLSLMFMLLDGTISTWIMDLFEHQILALCYKIYFSTYNKDDFRLSL